MAYWHYQLMKHTEEDGNEWYGIHEYFPVEDGDGWTESTISIDNCSVEDVKWMLEAMRKDIDKHGIKEYN